MGVSARESCLVIMDIVMFVLAFTLGVAVGALLAFSAVKRWLGKL